MILLASALAVSQVALASPDKRIGITVAADGTRYSVTRNRERILLDAPLGLELADGGAFSGLRIVDVRRQSHRGELTLTAAKAARARDWYNGATIHFREVSGARRDITIELRAYDDGVAFRYVLPGGTPVALKGETTGFRFAGDPTCEVTEYSGSHENAFQTLKVSQLDAAKLYDVPVVCASMSGRTHFALAQAGIEGYAGSSFRPVSGGLQVRVTPRKDRPEVAVLSPGGLHSAWRVVMMGDRAGDLIESTLIQSLSPAPQGDFSWVKPGKTAWDWWSGPTVGERPTMERFRRFIDFAAASHIPYFLIDAGWALNAGPCCAADPKTDITRSDPAIDMPALVAYASSKGVGLLLWVHWQHIAPRMDEILDTYRRWGIKGVKVDFMERDDQEMVEFYVRLARATAQRHLLLDMHGAFPPAGLARTYPNYITQEGVMGAEYNKFPWGRVTPGHNVKLAYTRMLLGPMDYTPGGFRNSAPNSYEQREVMPRTRHTRGQALAQYVVYDSPLQMVADSPDAYENAAGFDFIEGVPTDWDETRFVTGTPTSHVVLARRKGTDWYIGAMTNEDGREIDIPLRMLGDGKYAATIWQDGASANDVGRTSAEVTRRQTLHVRMSPGGGAAILLKRLR
ncbi:glycoside hydrolase family 97 protein [Sphingomonas sp. LB-2]|uniref:glycoside hydrolase family 97 protein n=1 Tax=Sphingomonas caeni TaxID=2984949 RepID=UPI00222E1F23|nr:glycoside hydrolase family 97 protein [Sphingomonas caeni]MCW3849514.1 glycoside hydrolase family 97 protein [Sphingomonas caeni]